MGQFTESFQQDERELMFEILSRKKPDLLGEVGNWDVLSQEQFERILGVVGGEEAMWLDADWEPTPYSRRIESLADSISRKWMPDRPRD